jgi:uncharacterized protein with HEPN domain
MGVVCFDESVTERPWRTVVGMRDKISTEMVPWGTKLTLSGAVEAYMT